MDPATTSWACWVLAHGETEWATNALRFATKEEADAWGRDLLGRWTAAKETESRPSTDPVNYRWTGFDLVKV
jgi:hypothetical protein